MKRLLILIAGLAVAAAGLVGFVTPSPSAAASGPCSVNSAALDSEETQFLGLLQQWRVAHVAHPTPLEPSGALNAAAAWFAEWQVGHGAPGGHNDDSVPGGRYFNQRAADCGYDSYFALGGSGEGVYAVASSAPVSIGPSQAIIGISYAGSGIYIDSGSAGWPAKCVGVAVKRNTAGTVVAWVAVLAQYPASSPCPGGSGGTVPTSTSPSPSSSATKTATPTSTPTKTPTPSPTPSPTPPPPRSDGATINLSSGWNLVVIPPGNLDEVLYRAKGCFRSVYQQQGERWVRYSPEVPAYARNLQTSDGGVFWVEGAAEGCGVVPL